MSTFLELVNTARLEAGVAGSDLSTLQSGLSLESNRFKSWVKREWEALQVESQEWQFLRLEREFDTTASQASYTAQQAKATNDGTITGTPILADWVLGSFRISTTALSYGDEAILPYITWEEYRDLYQFGAMRTSTSKPVCFTISPDKKLYLGNTPDAQYRVGYTFYRTPQSLSADADEPLMPARFHELIAWRALRAYGVFTSAPEVISRADDRISYMHLALCNDQLPTMTTGSPLA